MNGPAMEFCLHYLLEHEVKDKTILDVGSFNVNGTFKHILQNYNPKSYTGVDMTEGPDVDEICDACNLISHFGGNSFDIVVSAEMLEHVKDWKKAIHNIKTVIKPNGTMLITTRSYGFIYHPCPEDFWRFSIQDMIHIFSDCIITGIMSDYVAPGIFIKAVKPKNFKELNLNDFNVYSMQQLLENE